MEGMGLKMKNMEYIYHNGTNVFEHATVEAYPHESVALVDPSGEGKTTMLRLILSLLRAQKEMADSPRGRHSFCLLQELFLENLQSFYGRSNVGIRCSNRT